MVGCKILCFNLEKKKNVFLILELFFLSGSYIRMYWILMYDDVNNKKNMLINVVCVLGLVFDDNKLYVCWRL